MARKAASVEPTTGEVGLPLDRPLVGHANQQRTILDALRSNRMHHGWLLHGPKGVGKARFAAQAAAYLVAESTRHRAGNTLDLDLAHPDARLVAQGAHPDLHWIDRQTASDSKKRSKTIPVGAVRSTLQKLQATAAYDGWRVLVVDAVDELNVEGLNALLKPLEEPSRNTVILLVAHALNQVLPTIRSRCRHLSFGPIEAEEMQRFASDISQPDQADLLIALSEGRGGHLVALASQPEIVEAFASFCSLAAATGGQADSRTIAKRLTFAHSINSLQPEARDLLLELIEDWMSRRVSRRDEPGGLASPPPLPHSRAQRELAELWSEHTAAVRTRLAINLDLLERVMALFDGLDRVYSLR